MSNFASKIRDMITLSAYTLSRNETIETGKSVSEAFFVIKNETWDSDDDAVLSKHITTVASPDGQITDDGATSHHAVFYFKLEEADTELLSPYLPYQFGIKLKISGDYIVTETGQIFPLPGVVEAE